MDEVRQVSYYQESLSRIVQLAASQQQPPLDYWIGHLVAKVSGSDFAVRLPAAIFGTGSSVLLYLLAGRFCALPLALFAALLGALLPFNQYFSQEARPYSIAIFFLLAVLWSLDSLLNSSRNLILRSVFFLLAAVGFFYSRTLSPLATLTVLFAILCGNLIILYGRRQLPDKKKSIKLLVSIGVLMGAFVLYLPVLRNILSSGNRYLVDNGTNLDQIKSLLQNFDLFPVWQAFAVQTEPLTIPLIILLLLAPIMTLWFSAKPHHALWTYIMLLLPGAAFLNIIMFQAKSNMPFRPPYAVYILPLTLLLCAGTIQHLWDLQNRIQPMRQLIRALVLSGCLLLIGGAVHGAVGYKSLQRKTDWRSLGEYLSVYDNQQVLLFHNISLYGYGPILRYYQGKAQVVDVSQLVMDPTKTYSPSTEPIFIFFQAAPYYLTGRSRYPIMQATSKLISEEGIEQVVKGQFLSLVRFNNLVIIRLRNLSGNLALDALNLLDHVMPLMEKQTELYDCFMVQAVLARLTGRDDWQVPLALAESLAPANMVDNVRQMGNLLASYPVKRAEVGINPDRQNKDLNKKK